MGIGLFEGVHSFERFCEGWDGIFFAFLLFPRSAARPLFDPHNLRLAQDVLAPDPARFDGSALDHGVQRLDVDAYFSGGLGYCKHDSSPKNSRHWARLSRSIPHGHRHEIP